MSEAAAGAAQHHQHVHVRESVAAGPPAVLNLQVQDAEQAVHQTQPVLQRPAPAVQALVTPPPPLVRLPSGVQGDLPLHIAAAAAMVVCKTVIPRLHFSQLSKLLFLPFPLFPS